MNAKARPVRVLVADSHTLIREGLCALLAGGDGIEFVGVTASFAEVAEAVRADRPDVVLMGIDMILEKGAGIISRILEADADTRVLLLGEREERESILRGLMAGARGFIPTRADSAELVSAVKVVQQGDCFLYPSAARILVDEYLRIGPNASPDPYDQLSCLERAILKLVCQGSSSRQIAEILNIAPSTAMSHRAHMMAKLDARNQTELLRFAIHKNLATIESPAE